MERQGSDKRLLFACEGPCEPFWTVPQLAKIVERVGRKVGKVLLAILDCNLEKVKRGLAWHYKQYQRKQSPAAMQRLTMREERRSWVCGSMWNKYRLGISGTRVNHRCIGMQLCTKQGL